MFYLIDANREYILNFLPQKLVSIEIGVQEGKFSEKILQTSHPSIYHMVDPYICHSDESYQADPANVSQNSQEILYHKVLHKFSDEINKGSVYLHRKKSLEAVEIFPDNYFDFIYIDAMHHYDAVLADLNAYFPKLKTSGILAGHDYSVQRDARAMNFGVVEAVRDFLKTNDLQLFFITNEHFPSYFLAEPNSPLVRSVLSGVSTTTRTIFSFPDFFRDKLVMSDHNGQMRLGLSNPDDSEGSFSEQYFTAFQEENQGSSVEKLPICNYFKQLIKTVGFRFFLLLLLFSGRRRAIVDYVSAPKAFLGKKIFGDPAKATKIKPPAEKYQGTAELLAACNNKERLQLHFGCGPRILKDWINIDLQYMSYSSMMHFFDDYQDYFNTSVYPKEIQGSKNDLFLVDITKELLPIAANSVDVIFHEDFFEHLDQKEQFIFLAETYRVLKPGAIHRINTPDLNFIMGGYSKGERAKNIPVENWDKAVHKNIVSQKILTEMALLVGYSNIVFTGHNESSARGLPCEYRPGQGHPIEENLYADLIK